MDRWVDEQYSWIRIHGFDVLMQTGQKLNFSINFKIVCWIAKGSGLDGILRYDTICQASKLFGKIRIQNRNNEFQKI